MNTETFYNDHSVHEYEGWAILMDKKGSYLIFSEVLEYKAGKVRVDPASMVDSRFDTLGEAMSALRSKVKAGKSSGKSSKKTSKPIDALALLGINRLESEEQVMKAFRAKVKAMADGKGGYNGDMDALVNAKEKALQSIR